MGTISVPFDDRRQAGQVLAGLLGDLAEREDVVVLALPRGGVPVAYEVASALRAPLDVFTVRKLGVPGQRELAMGAIASGGVRVLNAEVVDALGLGEADIEPIEREERRELERREDRYRRGRPALDVAGRQVIVIDDGIATGSTMQAALQALRQLGPAAVVVATPTASSQACEGLGHIADRVVCAATPEPFRAVGLWYRRFDQTSDEEVEELLGAADHDRGEPLPE
jgi:predicted phosphoribosyltransferase